MPNPEDNLTDEEIHDQLLSLWNKYVTITEELLKFINKKDIDTFLELVDQRSKLIELMKKYPPEHLQKFRETEECKKMVDKIVPIDKEVMFKARAWLVSSKRQTTSVKGYGNFDAVKSSGRILNRQY